METEREAATTTNTEYQATEPFPVALGPPPLTFRTPRFFSFFFAYLTCNSPLRLPAGSPLQQESFLRFPCKHTHQNAITAHTPFTLFLGLVSSLVCPKGGSSYSYERPALPPCPALASQDPQATPQEVGSRLFSPRKKAAFRSRACRLRRDNLSALSFLISLLHTIFFLAGQTLVFFSFLFFPLFLLSSR